MKLVSILCGFTMMIVAGRPEVLNGQGSDDAPIPTTPVHRVPEPNTRFKIPLMSYLGIDQNQPIQDVGNINIGGVQLKLYEPITDNNLPPDLLTARDIYVETAMVYRAAYERYLKSQWRMAMASDEAKADMNAFLDVQEWVANDYIGYLGSEVGHKRVHFNIEMFPRSRPREGSIHPSKLNRNTVPLNVSPNFTFPLVTPNIQP